MTPTDDTGDGSAESGPGAPDRLVREAAAQLYAGAPGEFVSARTARVKSAKAAGHKEAAKEIAALRKPSVAAWALNQLVHRNDPVIGRLADLGERLRRATAALDAAAIGALRAERDAALADLVSAATTTASDSGQQLTAAVGAEVRDTGIAALADEAAELVLGSGTLTRALSYSGFGEVDLSEAAATTSTGVVLTSIRGGRFTTTSEDAGADEQAGSAADGVGEEVAEAENEAVENGDVENGDDESTAGEDDTDGDGAGALAEAAAAEEHARRLAQAEQAVATAEKEIGRRRAALEAARNRSDASRQRVQKLEEQLARARAEDDEALEKLTEAAAASKHAVADLAAATEHLAQLASAEDHQAP